MRRLGAATSCSFCGASCRSTSSLASGRATTPTMATRWCGCTMMVTSCMRPKLLETSTCRRVRLPSVPTSPRRPTASAKISDLRAARTGEQARCAARHPLPRPPREVSTPPPKTRKGSGTPRLGTAPPSLPSAPRRSAPPAPRTLCLLDYNPLFAHRLTFLVLSSAPLALPGRHGCARRGARAFARWWARAARG